MRPHREPQAFAGRILVPFAIQSQLSGVGAGSATQQRSGTGARSARRRSRAGRGCCSTSAPSTGKRTSSSTASVVGTPHRRLRSVLVRHHRRAEAGAASRSSSSRVRDPTDDGQQPRGKQVLQPRASGTPRSPASGRRSGSRPVPGASHRAACGSIRTLDAARSRSRVAVDRRAQVSRAVVVARRHARGRPSAAARPDSRSSCASRQRANCGRPTIRSSTRCASGSRRRRGRELLRHAQHRRRARRRRRAAAVPQRQAALPVRPARPGLVARRPLHRADRRSARVRHREDEATSAST